jgi:hypothetical protein
METEKWITIKNYPDYKISNLGNVKSFKLGRCRNLLLTKTTTGYHFVNLSHKGKSHPFNVHRLVAEHFIPTENNKLQVNHINGIKTDNRVENLEWITMSENIKHAYKTGLIINRGEFHTMSKLNRNDVEEIKSMLLNGEKQRIIAAIFNVDQAVISNIKLNKSY